MDATGPTPFGSLELEEAERISQDVGWCDTRYLPAKRGAVSVTGSEIDLGSLAITHEVWDARIHASTSTPAGTIGLGVRVDGPHECVGWGRQIEPSQLAVIAPDLDLILGADAGFVATVLDVAHLRRHAAQLDLDIEPGLTRSSGIVCSEAAGVLGRELKRIVRPGESTEAREELESRVLAAACDALSVPERIPRDFGRSQRVQIALDARDYIEANIAAPFRLEELTQAIGSNLRAVQRAFVDTFGMSPSRYVHARRLRLARRRLQRAETGSTTVTEIALDSGFAHLGRFSVDYRQAFGEHPSSTLRA